MEGEARFLFEGRRPMSDEEAAQEALIRWGEMGAVLRRSLDLVAQGLKPFAVGKSDGVLFEPLGQGQSWEEAFRDAAQEANLSRRLRF